MTPSFETHPSDAPQDVGRNQVRKLIAISFVLMAFGGMLSLSDRRLRVGAPKPAKPSRALQAAE